MPRRSRTRPTSDDWIGLREAITMLGVSPSTLRRWADEGAVRTFVTPGGHRRFSRGAVEGLLPGARRGHRTAEPLGETPAQMSRVYRRELGRDAMDDLGWPIAISPEDRALFRDHGRRIVRAALAALEASDAGDRERDLEEAAAASTEYGRAAAGIGLSFSTTVATYLRFRRPFLAELSALARRRGLDAADATELTDRARDMFDRLIVVTVRAQEATVASSRPPTRSSVDPQLPEVSLP